MKKQNIKFITDPFNKVDGSSLWEYYLVLFVAALILFPACNSTNSEVPEPFVEEFIRADINGETFIRERKTTTRKDYVFASLIVDEGKDRLIFTADSSSFPYVFFMGFSIFPPDGSYDTTYTIQSDIYDFQNAWASVSELDYDVRISEFNPIEGEENVLNIRNSSTEDGQMLVEGTFYMKMVRDTSYQNSESVVVGSQLADTLQVTNGSFRVVVEDLR